MKEMEKAVLEAFKGMAETGKINEFIESAVQETVGDIVNGLFRRYSDFGKALREYLEESLNVDFSGLGLEGYNDFILKIIKARLDADIYGGAQQQIGEALNEILKVPPKEIKLSELVKEFKEHVVSRNRNETPSGYCDVRYEKDNVPAGWGRLYLYDQRGKDKYSYKVELAHDGDGRIYVIRFGGAHRALDSYDVLDKEMFSGPHYGFERLLFQLYATRARLVIDMKDVDMEYQPIEDED